MVTVPTTTPPTPLAIDEHPNPVCREITTHLESVNTMRMAAARGTTQAEEHTAWALGRACTALGVAARSAHHDCERELAGPQ